MRVHVVLTGEKGRGGTVVSVHRTLSRATSAALNIRASFEGGWKEGDRKNYWVNGCDFVEVETWVLKD